MSALLPAGGKLPCRYLATTLLLGRRNLSKSALAFLASVLPGCMTAGKMNEIMASWVGHDVNSLIAAWGPPQQVMPDGKGGQIFSYFETRQYSTPGYSTTTSQVRASAWGMPNYASASAYGTSNTVTTAPQTYAWTVSRTFWVDANGRIYSWAWRGL